MKSLTRLVDQVFGPAAEVHIEAQKYREDAASEAAESSRNRGLGSYFDSRAANLSVVYPGLDSAIDIVRSFVADDELIRQPRLRAAAGLVALSFLEQSERFGNISDSLH